MLTRACIAYPRGASAGSRPQPDVVKGSSAGEPDLGLHQVHARDLLGHRVFHLQAGIGLDEHERPLRSVARGIDQELERPEIRVALTPGETHRRVYDRPAQFVRQPRRRRDLHQFLVSPLDAALPLAEVGDAALHVPQDLHFDMPGMWQELLDVHVGHAERGLRLGAASLVRRLEFVRRRHDTRAAPAAARDRFHDHRPAGKRRQEVRRLLERHCTVDALQHGNAGRPGRGPGAALVTEQFEMVRARPHERDPRVRAPARKSPPFGQETVARVYRAATGGPRRIDHRLLVQVRRRPDARQRPRLVGRPHVQARRVVLRVHGDGPQAEFPRRARDPDRDLSAVGDQQCIEGHQVPLHSVSGRDGALTRVSAPDTARSPRPGSRSSSRSG